MSTRFQEKNEAKTIHHRFFSFEASAARVDLHTAHQILKCRLLAKLAIENGFVQLSPMKRVWISWFRVAKKKRASCSNKHSMNQTTQQGWDTTRCKISSIFWRSFHELLTTSVHETRYVSRCFKDVELFTNEPCMPCEIHCDYMCIPKKENNFLVMMFGKTPWALSKWQCNTSICRLLPKPGRQGILQLSSEGLACKRTLECVKGWESQDFPKWLFGWKTCIQRRHLQSRLSYLIRLFGVW